MKFNRLVPTVAKNQNNELMVRGCEWWVVGKGSPKEGGEVCVHEKSRVCYTTVVAQTRSKKYPRGYTHCGVVYMLHTIHSYCST
jgi:hypothetical protein